MCLVGEVMGLLGRFIRYVLTKAEIAVIPLEVEAQIMLDVGAQMPTQPYSSDACWDLYAREDIWARPGLATHVSTGVYINIPPGYEGELKARSSHGKEGILIHHGAFDTGYQGEISPFIINLTPARLEIRKGDRIAQFCLRRKCSIKWEKVPEFTASERGTAGHGSSGK